IVLGVPRERIAILASDGSDPAPDFAKRADEAADFWLLEGTGLAPELDEPLEFEDTRVAGFTPEPATRAHFDAWLKSARTKLSAGDTLLVYVTDHGDHDERDPLRNEIVLWRPPAAAGRASAKSAGQPARRRAARGGIDVRELGAAFARLPAGVRV